MPGDRLTLAVQRQRPSVRLHQQLRNPVTYVGEHAPGVTTPAAETPRATLKDIVTAYVGLTKPRVIEL